MSRLMGGFREREREREGRDEFWKLLTCTLDSTRHFQKHVVTINGSIDHIGDGIRSPRTQNPRKVLTLEQWFSTGAVPGGPRGALSVRLDIGGRGEI